ncbi:hypothetical protein WN48_08191 [Eufriesea mexicana]|nr:hypothetical protein WN48_08191 [Eufriesea mexicana]
MTMEREKRIFYGDETTNKKNRNSESRFSPKISITIQGDRKNQDKRRKEPEKIRVKSKRKCTK